MVGEVGGVGRGKGLTNISSAKLMNSQPHWRLFLAALWMIVLLGSGRVQGASAEEHLFIVMVGFQVDAESHVQNLRVERILEPLGGPQHPTSVELPEDFLANAKKKLEAEKFKMKLKDGEPAKSLANFVYVPPVGLTGTPAGPISLGALNGAIGDISTFEIGGRGCQSSMFVRPGDAYVTGVTYYAIPDWKYDKTTAEKLIDAEINRCMAHIRDPKVISRKDASTDGQSIQEVVIKSSESKILSIRFRMICSARDVLSLIVTSRDDLDVAMHQATDNLFEKFRFQ